MEELIKKIVSTEGIFTALFIVGVVYTVTKLIPLAFKAHKEVIATLVIEHKTALDKITNAFLKQIESNEEWRTTIDNRFREHGEKIDDLKISVEKIIK